MDTIHVEDVAVLRALPASGARKPVLFVHGYFVDGSIWTKWLSFFAERGVPAYAVHLRGRAGSRPATNLGAASIEDFVEDAAIVARHVGATCVVGHSMGGLIAQKLAERYEARATVLITPAPPKGISVLSPRLAMRQIRYLPSILRSRPVQPGREDLRALVLNRVPPQQQDEILDKMIADSGRAGRDMSITGVPVDATRVTGPMFVVAAEDDRFIPARIVERVAARYHAPVYVAPHHGHLLLLEPNWEEIAGHVEHWIRAHA